MEVAPEAEMGIDELDLGHDVERPSDREHEVVMAEGFEAPSEPGAGPPDALGDDPQLAEVGGEDGEDPIGLPEVVAVALACRIVLSVAWIRYGSAQK